MSDAPRPPRHGDPRVSHCPWSFPYVENGERFAPCEVPIQGGTAEVAKHVATVHHGRWPSASVTM